MSRAIIEIWYKAAEIGQIIQAEDGVNVACNAIERQLQAVARSS